MSRVTNVSGHVENMDPRFVSLSSLFMNYAAFSARESLAVKQMVLPQVQAAASSGPMGERSFSRLNHRDGNTHQVLPRIGKFKVYMIWQMKNALGFRFPSLIKQPNSTASSSVAFF